MLGSMGPAEWLIILCIILLLFGARRLPEIARSLGKGIKEFKKAGREVTDDIGEEEGKQDSKKDD